MTIRDWGLHWAGATGRAKGQVIAQMMQELGYSKQTCYARLTAEGFSSGKKRRRDAGRSSVSEADLHVLAAMLREGLRDNGKEQLKIPEARSIMAMNGYSIEVSNRQLSRLLRQLQLDMASLKQPAPHTRLLSLHPNHVGQVDPSYCSIYYLRNGKQVILRDSETYKNKHDIYERLTKAKLKVWRYVYVDHYSGCIYCRYFNAAGENQENLYEFLLQCWNKKVGNPFHGVPELLLMDKGSANTAKAMIQALNSLGVQVESHAPGNSRAKGAVEKANDIVETTFESRLRFEPLHSIAELNIAAESYFIAWNANAIPERDSRLRRPGGTYVREQLWLQIQESELRLLPDIAQCRRLLLEPTQERRVSDERTISYMQHAFTRSGGIYSLAQLEVNVGQKVQVQSLAYDGPAILVTYKDYQGNEQQARIAEPLPIDGAGRLSTGAVIGAQYKAVKDDNLEQNRRQLVAAAHPEGKQRHSVPFAHVNEGKGLQSHNQIIDAVEQHRKKVKTIPKCGTPIHLGTAQLYEREYSLSEALAELKRRLEDSGHEYDKVTVPDLLKAQMKGGKLAEQQLDRLCQRLRDEQNYIEHRKEA